MHFFFLMPLEQKASFFFFFISLVWGEKYKKLIYHKVTAKQELSSVQLCI